MTSQAVVAEKPKNWMDTLTPEQKAEHLAKMKKGREDRAARLAAEKKPAAPDPAAYAAALHDATKATETEVATRVAGQLRVETKKLLDERDAEIESLKKRLLAVNAKLDPPVDVSTLPAREIFFEFRRNPKAEMEKILTSADARWEEFKSDAWTHVCHGSLIINRFTRDKSGEIVKRTHETVNQMLYGPALEAMLRFEQTGKHYIEGNPVKA